MIGSWAACWAPMRRLFPSLAALDVARSTLPSFVSLQTAHTGLLARRDSVETDFTEIEAAALRAASLPAGARVPHALAYHPVGLPKESSLPSLTPRWRTTHCKLNTRAQRKFAAVVHIEEWLAIAMDLQGLDGAMRAREISRLIGVSQPLAGAFGPSSSPCRGPASSASGAASSTSRCSGGSGCRSARGQGRARRSATTSSSRPSTRGGTTASSPCGSARCRRRAAPPTRARRSPRRRTRPTPSPTSRVGVWHGQGDVLDSGVPP